MGAGGKARLTEVIITDWRPREEEEEEKEERKGGGTGGEKRNREREDADKRLSFF